MSENNYIKELNQKLIRQKVGKLTILRQVESYKNKGTTRSRFLCECECRKYRIVEGTKLRKSKITQCTDCSYKGREQSKQKYSDLERLYNLSIIARCKKGKIENNLPLEDYSLIISQNCNYCGEPPRKITYLDNNKIVKGLEIYANGVDRINSDKGYSLKNCVSCCKTCNYMKSTLELDNFKNHIKKVYNFLCKQEDIIRESLDMS